MSGTQTQIATSAGEVVVLLPDRIAGQLWGSLEMLLARAAAGEDTGHALPAPGAARCACGESRVAALRMRIGDGKLVCNTCASRSFRLVYGHLAAFRLADSDLAQYVQGPVPEVVLRGVVEQVSAAYREVTVRVEGWKIPHTVDVDDLVERSATLPDMREFWPDKTDEQLRAAYSEIVEAGHVMTVTCRRAVSE